MAETLYKKLSYKILYAQTSSVRVSRTVIINLNEVVFLRTRSQQKDHIELNFFGGSLRE